MLKRREFVRLLLSAAAMRLARAQETSRSSPTEVPAPAPVPWTLGIGQLEPVDVPATKPETVGQFDAVFFSTGQMATLRRLCSVLLPPIAGKPGALECGTAEFLDTFIGESDEESRQLYQKGLDWLGAESIKTFGVGFDKTSDGQADQVLRPWLSTWIADHLPSEPRAHFVNAVHADIRLATINSPAWDRVLISGGVPPPEKLYWLPIEPDVFHFRVNQQGK
jgi:hypothetical protein